MDTVDTVFPPQMDILTPFVERLIDDVISEYITELVDKAHAQSMESYLKAVSGVFELSLRFIISLKTAKSTPLDFQKKAREAMIRCFDRHLDLYFTEELEFFRRRAENEVDSWGQRLLEQETSTETFFMSNVSRQAAKQDFMSSFKNMMLLPVTAVASIPGTFTSKKTPTSHIESTLTEKRSSTPTPLDRHGTPRPPESAPTSELAAKAAIMNSRLEGIKTLFSIEIALNLVHSAKTSLERMAIFVKPLGEAGTLARKQCEAIFVTLVHILGTRHVQQGFDKAVSHLSDYKP
jgi:recyclin-1